jgi:hypothetical protein
MIMNIIGGATNTSKPMLLFSSVFDQGTVTATATTSEGSFSNALEDTTFDFWTPSALPGIINVDAGSPVNCDCVGFAAHNLGTTGGALHVSSSTDGVNWTLRSATSPLTDDTAISIFPQVSARYWRVAIISAVSSIGVIKLGKRLVIDGGLLSGHVSIDHARRVELLHNSSMSGQFLSNRVLRVGADTELNFGLLEAEFVDTQMGLFERHFNEGGTFFYAGSPSKYPRDIGYCWRSARGGEMRPSYDEGGLLMPVSLQVSAYVR